MSEKEKHGELCHITICCVENGYSIECSYKTEETLSQKAGWVPTPFYSDCKKYVAKSDSDLLKRLEEIIKEK